MDRLSSGAYSTVKSNAPATPVMSITGRPNWRDSDSLKCASVSFLALNWPRLCQVPLVPYASAVGWRFGPPLPAMSA
jgi:hypothetical protein